MSTARPVSRATTKELLRGAIVFAVGALDAFLLELVLEIVPRFGGDQHALGEALRAIAKDDPGLALRLALSPDGASKEDEFRKALGDWLDRKSFQGVARVSNALTYVGLSLTIADFDSHTGKNTAERLEYYTQLRHNIVHRGQRPNVVRNNARECVDLIACMGAVINTNAVAFYH